MEIMLLSSFGASGDYAAGVPASRITGAFQRNDLDAVIAELNALLADVPYDMWQRGDEGIDSGAGPLPHSFVAIVHLTFRLVGVRVRSEVHTHPRRNGAGAPLRSCDAIVETDTHV